MANQELFGSARHRADPADTTNLAGGRAYALAPKQALAQLAATGCLGATYYASAAEQLDDALRLAAECDPVFVAKVAVYARARGHMKDMPALLLARLTARGPEGVAACRAAFPRVIDNGKMLRNFAQIVRSGRVGRKSFGSAVRRMIRDALAARRSDQLFRDSVGDKPSLADVIRMVHPKPADDQRRALYAYLIGKPHNAEHLPELVRAYEAYKAAKEGAPPDVPFQMLDSLGLDTAGWSAVAKRAGWQMTRMNLNTFKRHGVLEDADVVRLLARRLRDPEEIARARVFPYQLLVAYKHAQDVPYELTEALQDAMEHAVANVPSFGGDVVVCPDVSGSMQGAVTGHRVGATSAVRCVDVAALITAAVLRKNASARVIPFEQTVVNLRLNPRDSVMTLANQIASVGGGGTNCSAPLRMLNAEGSRADLVIYVSDNESWMDVPRWGGASTAMAQEWAIFKKRNSRAKLVCIDLTPNTTAQVTTAPDRLNVGGFSDAVFDVIRSFMDAASPDAWVATIEEVKLE